MARISSINLRKFQYFSAVGKAIGSTSGYIISLSSISESSPHDRPIGITRLD